MVEIYNKIEKNIGSLKFAVIIILVFTICMTVGTFVESWYGTDFVNRLIYKTPFFMLVQFFMGLSILFATFRRLPAKKRLYGFYVIHTGLITLGIGSFVTYIAGIDGTIHLPPKTPTRTVVLNEDVIEVISPEKNTRATLALPYTPFKKQLDIEYEDIKVLDYLPFAEKETKWTTSETNTTKKLKYIHSSTYVISNPNVTQDFTLSLHPEAFDYKSSLSMGLLNITYLPFGMFECFNKENSSGIIIWDSKKETCFTLDEKGIEVQETSSGKRFFAIRHEGEVFSFLPDMSPWAMDINLKPIMNSPFRAFSMNLFKDKAHLFLFGRALAYFDKDEKKWVTDSIDEKKVVELPWMGFELRMTKFGEREAPLTYPKEVTPIQQNGGLVIGNIRAARIKVQDKSYWLTNEKPLNLLIDGVETRIYMTKKSYNLPFELTLDRFKMDKDPGTNNPASYESFINLFKSNGNESHHVFMNNPLKYDGFTFYQASYSQDPETGAYSSTLSVNVDQGRPIKYLGSLLLVFGSIWHYTLNRRSRKKENDILGIDDKEDSKKA